MTTFKATPFKCERRRWISYMYEPKTKEEEIPTSEKIDMVVGQYRKKNYPGIAEIFDHMGDVVKNTLPADILRIGIYSYSQINDIKKAAEHIPCFWYIGAKPAQVVVGLRNVRIPLQMLIPIASREIITTARAEWWTELFKGMYGKVPPVIIARLMEAHVQDNQPETALKIFQDVAKISPDNSHTPLFNAAISALLSQNKLTEAIDLMTKNPEIITEKTYKIFLSYYLTHGDLNRADKIISAMHGAEFPISQNLYHLALRACALGKNLELAKRWYEYLIRDFGRSDEAIILMVNVCRACGNSDLEAEFWAAREKINFTEYAKKMDERTNKFLKEVQDSVSRERIAPFFKFIHEKFGDTAPVNFQFKVQDNGQYHATITLGTETLGQASAPSRAEAKVQASQNAIEYINGASKELLASIKEGIQQKMSTKPKPKKVIVHDEDTTKTLFDLRKAMELL